MKPAPFAYSAPASVAEVIGLLDIFEDEAKVIAGGQSLAAMLNMRLARPANLVDLRKLGSELSYIVDEGSQVRIGALTRHAQVERFAFVGAPSLLSKAAPYIGHPSIRSRGTIGGSVAHADPAAEFPAALTALGARFVLRSVDGTREVTPEEFFLSFYMTSIEATELLTEIVVPTWGPTTGTSFVEFARRCGDFAVTGTAVAAELAPDGAIAHLGIGICWGADFEEWVIYLSYLPNDLDRLDESLVLDRVRRCLGTPDFKLDVRKITHWSWEHLVAERVQVGRVFLVGDAAHRHPPMGGLGLNAAVGDVSNLCWKLKLVMSGVAEPDLLTTYAEERLPVGAYYADRSIENLRNYARLDAVLGLSQDKTPEENWAAVRRLWDNDPRHDEFRHEVKRVFASQSMEYREHNVHEGMRYASGAVIPDELGEPIPNPDPIRLYIPSTVPGTHIPHAWVERGVERLGVDQLVEPGHFLLIAGENGEDWLEAAERCADELGVPLTAVSISHLDGQWLDPRLAWVKQRQVGADGCVLVRPDRYVAWRSETSVHDCSSTLAAILGRLLGREGA
ncbi:FAD binding domain-containing protein [Rhodococcus qingshengii]|uniref:FAD binding domain-containing protein n=1 Tax=Rhodococcus qingshengii TaxID=334542 RepID=UPI00301B5D10